ncbi:aryl sulfotransferase, partial [Salmonella enterica subsp. enterica serovar Infantis]
EFPIHDIFDRRHWPMSNGLSVTRAGLVLMSLRTTSGVIAVDKESGKGIWHAGPEVVAQQHTPVEMENGSILVFDNGNLRPGVTSPQSTVLEF